MSKTIIYPNAHNGKALALPKNNSGVLYSTSGAVLISDWCDIFGDDINGAKRITGGLGYGKVTTNWYCPTRAIGRFRMVCEHGHKGQVIKPCQKHFTEFNGKVKFCPRCNIPPNDHRCTLTMEPVS